MANNTAAQVSAGYNEENSGPTLRHGFLIHDVSRLRRTVFDQRMKPMGVTRSQWWVLTNLSRHEGDALTQSELAKLMEVGKVTVGGLIDRLEANGLVIRAQDPNDRRSRRISVSPKGKQLVEDMRFIAMDINSSSLKGVTEEQLQVLIDVLQTMKKNLSSMEGR
ncbi:MAG: MarR family transcriptional regulator [Tissierellales bacterium]